MEQKTVSSWESFETDLEALPKTAQLVEKLVDSKKEAFILIYGEMGLQIMKFILPKSLLKTSPDIHLNKMEVDLTMSGKQLALVWSRLIAVLNKLREK